MGKGASYGASIVCASPYPISLPSGAHIHLGPEAQWPSSYVIQASRYSELLYFLSLLNGIDLLELIEKVLYRRSHAIVAVPIGLS